MELMLLPAQDLLVVTSMSMGPRVFTTVIMTMLAICFDRIIINITDTMMMTMNLTMKLKFNVVINSADLKLKITTRNTFNM